MDGLIDLLTCSEFWILWGGAFAVLCFLRAAADHDLRSSTVVARGRTYVGPPGVWGIPIGGGRALDIGDHCARFINPKGFMGFVAYEPSLLLWCVVVWCLFAGATDWGLGLLLCLIVHRLVAEGARHFENEPSSGRRRRAIVKIIFAVASGIHYACLAVTVVGVLFLIGMCAAGAGSRRRHWRRDRDLW